MARIVIAEDDKDLRELCEMSLKQQGHEVDGVGDGYEVLHLVRKKAPDLLVLDLMLPSRSGVELINTLRSIHPTMLVVIHTGYSQYKDSFVARLADAFVLKSPNLNHLLSVVNNLLGCEQDSKEKERDI